MKMNLDIILFLHILLQVQFLIGYDHGAETKGEDYSHQRTSVPEEITNKKQAQNFPPKLKEPHLASKEPQYQFPIAQYLSLRIHPILVPQAHVP